MAAEPMPKLDMIEVLIAATDPLPVVHRAIRCGVGYTMWAYIARSPVQTWPPSPTSGLRVVFMAAPTPVSEHTRRADLARGFVVLYLKDHVEEFRFPVWESSGTILLPIPGLNKEKGAASGHPDAKIILQHTDRPEHVRRDLVSCLAKYGRDGLLDAFMDRAHEHQLDLARLAELPPLTVKSFKPCEARVDLKALMNFDREDVHEGVVIRGH